MAEEFWASHTDADRGWGVARNDNGEMVDVIYIDQRLAERIRKPEWFSRASCREWERYKGDPDKGIPHAVPADIFFPEPTGNGGNHLAPARRICLECPVRMNCLEYGLNEAYGVWGGHSPSQRRKINSLVKKGSSLLEASRLIDQRSRDAR